MHSMTLIKSIFKEGEIICMINEAKIMGLFYSTKECFWAYNYLFQLVKTSVSAYLFHFNHIQKTETNISLGYYSFK